MARNERLTCKEVIEPALSAAGWSWQEQLRIGPGKVNLTGDTMYDETQSIIADYLLRYRSVPLLILEAKAEGEDAADGMQQASRYARRLSIRFSLATNGADWILTDNDTGDFETLSAPPTPEEIITRFGVSIDWERWEETFSSIYHVDQVTKKSVRPYQDMAINKTLWQFAQGNDRVLLLMATGTGKTFTVFPAGLEALERAGAQARARPLPYRSQQPQGPSLPRFLRVLGLRARADRQGRGR
jgi:type I restriction enzyme R subunit